MPSQSSHCPRGCLVPRPARKAAWALEPKVPLLLLHSPVPSAWEFGRGSSGAPQPSFPPKHTLRPLRSLHPQPGQDPVRPSALGPAAPPPCPALRTLNLPAPGGGSSASGQSREALAAAGPRGGLGGLGGRRRARLCWEARTARDATRPTGSRRTKLHASLQPSALLGAPEPRSPPEQAGCGRAAGAGAEAGRGAVGVSPESQPHLPQFSLSGDGF